MIAELLWGDITTQKGSMHIFVMLLKHQTAEAAHQNLTVNPEGIRHLVGREFGRYAIIYTELCQ